MENHVFNQGNGNFTVMPRPLSVEQIALLEVIYETGSISKDKIFEQVQSSESEAVLHEELMKLIDRDYIDERERNFTLTKKGQVYFA